MLSFSLTFPPKPQLDYSGLRHCKVTPAHRLSKNVRLVKIGMAQVSSGEYPPGTYGGAVGEVFLINPLLLKPNASVPQPTPYCTVSYKPVDLPWHPNHSVLLADLTNLDGTPWIQCPRACLRRATSVLNRLGLKAMVGFELEFYLLHPTDHSTDPENPRFKVFDDINFSQYASFTGFNLGSSIIDEMISCLEAVHIPVITTHREAAPGQFEIVLDYCEVFEAVDRVVLAREVVRAVAMRHGLRASFVPKIDDWVGNGGHVHLSLDGHFGTTDVWHGQEIGVDVVGRSFMAGVTSNLPWLCYLVNNHPISYNRVVPGYWAGAYRAWGYSNREAPVRLMDDRTNFEIKVCDAISNPYIAMAGILTAGALGVVNKLELTEPCQEDPLQMEKDKRPLRLPERLEDAMKEFEKVANDDIVAEVFPEEMMHDMKCVKMADIEYLKSNGPLMYQSMMVNLH